MSALAKSTDFFWVVFNQYANLAIVVVLPDPCRPTIIMTAGGCVCKLRVAQFSPNVVTSSSYTTLIKASPGLRLVKTSWPIAWV